MMIYKRGFIDHSQGLAIGLVATGATLVFVCTFFVAYIRRVRQRKELAREVELGLDYQPPQRMTSSGNIHTKVLAPLPQPPRAMFGSSRDKSSKSSKRPLQPGSEHRSTDMSSRQMTQFEIEIGRKERTGSLNLTRLRSKDSSESSQKTRRRLSKQSPKVSIDLHRRPAVPMRDHSGSTELAPSITIDLTSGSSTGSGFTKQHTTPASSASYNRNQAPRKRSASAGIATKAAESPSVSTDSKTWSDQHGRSISYGGGLIGPAPIGPLPPLPTPAAHSSSTKVAAIEEPLPQYTSNHPGRFRQLAERASPKPSSNPASISSDLSRWCVPGHAIATPSPARSVHSQSASVYTWQSTSSGSPELSSKGLWISPIRIAGTGRVHRASSVTTPNNPYRLQAVQNMKTFNSTPRQKPSRTMEATNGSPTSKRQGAVLQDVEANAVSIPRRYRSARSKEQIADRQIELQLLTPTRKPSAMKGPGSRKGHRRQNCVRISRLPPTVMNSSQSSLLVGIKEESPRGSVAGVPVPVYASRPNLRSSSRASSSPLAACGPIKWTASLKPNSPTPAISASALARRQPSNNVSRESSGILSTPSIPSLGQKLDFSEKPATPVFASTQPTGDSHRDEGALYWNFESPVQPARYDDTDFSWSPAKGSEDGYDYSWTPLVNQSSREALIPRDSNDVAIDMTLSPNTSTTHHGQDLGALICSAIGVSSNINHSVESTTQHKVDILSACITPLKTGTCTPVPASPLSPRSDTCSPLRSHPPAKPLRPLKSPRLTELTDENHSPAPSSSTPVTRAWTSLDNQSSSGTHNNSSPTRVKQDMSASLQGPRPGPEKDLRLSIMKLRRENSEARWSGGREQRRYLKLGREASPVLPFGISSFQIYSDDAEDLSLLDDVQTEPLSDPALPDDASDIIAIYADARDSMLRPEPLDSGVDPILKLLDGDKQQSSLLESELIFPSPALPDFDPTNSHDMVVPKLPAAAPTAPQNVTGISIVCKGLEQASQPCHTLNSIETIRIGVENPYAAPMKDPLPGLRMMMVQSDDRHFGTLSPVEEIDSRASSRYGMDQLLVSPKKTPRTPGFEARLYNAKELV